ncbi:MAG: hypothetical protein Q9159_002349, partial [Coniocarpon cinnabarinum]
MPPLRRYLRITPHSILETRIYLTDPYQTSWLTSSTPTISSTTSTITRDPATTTTPAPILTRIITAIRPYVLRQLREERERALSAKPAKRRKITKDVAVEEDFEVSVFLTESGCRHQILVKQRGISGNQNVKGVKRRKGRAGKLTGWLEKEESRDVIDVDAEQGPDQGEAGNDAVPIREESDDEGGKKLEEYAEISDDEGFVQTQARRQTEMMQEADEKKKKALD